MKNSQGTHVSFLYSLSFLLFLSFFLCSPCPPALRSPLELIPSLLMSRAPGSCLTIVLKFRWTGSRGHDWGNRDRLTGHFDTVLSFVTCVCFIAVARGLGGKGSKMGGESPHIWTMSKNEDIFPPILLSLPSCPAHEPQQ